MTLHSETAIAGLVKTKNAHAPTICFRFNDGSVVVRMMRTDPSNTTNISAITAAADAPAIHKPHPLRTS
jgi:hypothetical protein